MIMNGVAALTFAQVCSTDISTATAAGLGLGPGARAGTGAGAGLASPSATATEHASLAGAGAGAGPSLATTERPFSPSPDTGTIHIIKRHSDTAITLTSGSHRAQGHKV